MTGAAGLLLCCLLQGALCQSWSVFLPQSLETLSDSCVVIPCRFTLADGWDSSLDATCKAIWRRGRWVQTPVFDSSLTGINAQRNTLQGKLTGNLLDKNCTTVFNDLPASHYDDYYYFRIECHNSLKYNYETSVKISVKDSLPNPTLTPSRVEVLEGTSIHLTCSAAAPCPSQLPTLTWTPDLGEAEEKPVTQAVTSVLTFTASHLHHGQKISCTALYHLQAGKSDLSLTGSLTVSVLYPPNNTSVSPPGPVLEGSSVTLTCSSVANPAVDSYAWYSVDGDPITPVGFRKTLYPKVTEDNSQFYCEAQNRYGTQNSSIIQIDVQFPPKETTVSADPSGPLLEGHSVMFTCTSHANPPPTNYSWYHVNGDNENMVESGPTYGIDVAQLYHGGGYYCEAKNDYGEAKSAAIQLAIQYPPKNTSVSAEPSGPVLEGSSVTLTCSSMANPAVQNYTWYRTDGREKEAVGSDKEFTFNATKLSSEVYSCEALNDHGAEDSEPVSVDVTFAAEILPSSRCVKILSRIRCSCESQGNPPPSLQWELAGEPVNHSADIPVGEVSLGSMGRRSFITLLQVEDMPSVVCVSSNSVGSDKLAFNVSSSEIQIDFLGLHTISLLIGSGVGAAGMMLLCALVHLIVCRKKKGGQSPNREVVDASEVIETDGDTHVEVVYANKAMLEDAGREVDALHYANMDFAKLQARSEDKLGEGGIRGLSSRTAEYAEIRLDSREDIGGGVEDIEVAEDTTVVQGKNLNGQEA
ncbi:sialic acid-binding Ig-like lectin 10, partial [Lampris incognitus]|uniref:sialic acid-binding Ig-like lectin 10 n=1 Tax=Lampris incognitus TaxID=2546036 RepID=UPI0024B5AFD4